MNQLIFLTTAWILYFALHSLLAGNTAKRMVSARWPRFYRRYRLTYNVLAVVLIVPLLVWTFSLPSTSVWQWRGILAVVANGLALLATAGFMWTARYYDMDEFLGLKPAPDQEPDSFRLSPLHRYVRHPWYFLGLVILWTRDMSDVTLTLTVCATLYLVLGSRLEDGKLVQTHGKQYADYMRRVPGLLPSPFRYLSRSEAAKLASVGRR